MKERPILFTPENARANREGRKTMTRRVMKPQPDEDCTRIRSWGDGMYIPESRTGKTGIFDPREHRCPYGQPGDLLWVRETWTDVNLGGCPGIAYKADGGIKDLMIEMDCHCADGSFDYDDPRVVKLNFTAWHSDQFGDEPGSRERWRSPIYMPRWASRTTLRVTDVRVERVQEISFGDAVVEGATVRRIQGPYGEYAGWSMDWSRVGSLSRFAGGIHPRGEEQPLTESDVALGSPQTAFGNLWDSINAKRGYGWGVNPFVWVVSYELAKETS